MLRRKSKILYEPSFETGTAMKTGVIQGLTSINKSELKKKSVTAGSAPLSPHYIMLIRPKQALLLARLYSKLFVFKYIFQI